MVPRLRTLRCMRRQLRRGRLAAADGQAGARACELPQIVCRSFWHRLAIGLYVFSISLYRPTPALASLAGRQRGRRDTDSADSAPTEYGGACSRSAAACHRGREGGWSQGARGRLVSIGCARAAGHRGREGGWSASGARGRLVSSGGAREAGQRGLEGGWSHPALPLPHFVDPLRATRGLLCGGTAGGLRLDARRGGTEGMRGGGSGGLGQHAARRQFAPPGTGGRAGWCGNTRRARPAVGFAPADTARRRRVVPRRDHRPRQEEGAAAAPARPPQRRVRLRRGWAEPSIPDPRRQGPGGEDM